MDNTPIQANKRTWQQLMGLSSTETSKTLRDYKATQMNDILSNLFPTKPKSHLAKWRTQYCKTHGKATPLWDCIQACEDDGAKIPNYVVKASKSKSNSKSAAAAKRPAKRAKLNKKEKDKDTTDLQHWNDLLIVYRRKLQHTQDMQSIKPFADDSKNTEVKGLTCQICFDMYDTNHVVHCLGSQHPFCKPCFERYCLETMPSVTLTTIKCPLCPNMMPKRDVEATLSEWDIMALQEKDNRINCQVALNKDVLVVVYCQCGVVAVVEQQDKGSGVVLCTCGKAYCTTCGNFEHHGRPCPPPPETQAWMTAHSKLCPNCGNAIEKHSGCNHMTCQRPLGCAHEFCWLCLRQWGTCRCRIFSD